MSPSHRSVAEIKRHLTEHLTKVIDRASAARKRVDADQSLTAAQKAKLSADLNKLVTDATIARREVGAATTREGLEAARPALAAVRADRHRVFEDWEGMHGHRTPHPSAPPSMMPTAPSTS